MKRSSAVQALWIACCLCLSWLPAAAAPDSPKAADLVTDGQRIDLGTPLYDGLFQELRRQHNFEQAELERIFAGVSIKKRVLELMDTQWEAKPYYQYRPLFITEAVIEEGKRKLAEHGKLLDRVEAEFGVERQIVVAIWGIETRYGQHQGKFDIFQTLNTLFSSYPRRSKFYRGQLIHFLLLCRDNGIDPLTVSGSYGGAFGQTQFIPSSFREYAVDFDGDGRRDVWGSTGDVLASIANYLRRSGWVFGTPVYRELGLELRAPKLVEVYEKGRKGKLDWRELRRLQGVELAEPAGSRKLTVVGLELGDGKMRYVAGYPNFQAITEWNHSNRYAMAVSELAELLAAGP